MSQVEVEKEDIWNYLQIWLKYSFTYYLNTKYVKDFKIIVLLLMCLDMSKRLVFIPPTPAQKIKITWMRKWKQVTEWTPDIKQVSTGYRLFQYS
jgi:hypothetical protein